MTDHTSRDAHFNKIWHSNITVSQVFPHLWQIWTCCSFRTPASACHCPKSGSAWPCRSPGPSAPQESTPFWAAFGHKNTHRSQTHLNTVHIKYTLLSTSLLFIMQLFFMTVLTKAVLNYYPLPVNVCPFNHYHTLFSQCNMCIVTVCLLVFSGCCIVWLKCPLYVILCHFHEL